MDPKIKPFHLKILLGVLSVSLGSLFRTIIAKGIFLQPDEEIFGYRAYEYLLGGSLEELASHLFNYLGYPIVLSFWFDIFGVSLFSARMFSVICSGITIGIIYIILLKITKEARYAFAGSLLMALLPFPLRYGHIALTHPMVTMLVSLSILLLLIALEKDSWYLFVLSGIMVFLAVAVRRSALIMLFIIVPTLIWINRNSIKKMMKQTLCWTAGTVLPIAFTVSYMVHLYGIEKMKDMVLTRIPNVASDWSVSIGGTTYLPNFIFAAKPVIWYSLTLVVPLLIGGGILLMAIHKNRWRAVYAGAFLWPVIIRTAFSQEISSFSMFILMLLPVLPLLLEGSRKRGSEFYLALSILLGSSAAFSNIYLSNTIWNVIIYSSVGAVILLYLNDRISNHISDIVFMLMGMALLFLITTREPQMLRMASFVLPVMGISYCLSLLKLNSASMRIPLSLGGIILSLFLINRPWGAFEILSAVSFAAFIFMIIYKKKEWKRIKVFSIILVLSLLAFIPQDMPWWGIAIPVTITFIVLFSDMLKVKRGYEVVPIASASIIAFSIVLIDSGSSLLSGISVVLVGSLSALLTRIDLLSFIWKRKVPEKVSIILIMLIFGYLAFYVYYSWMEVYFTEFLFQAVIIAGILLWILMAGYRKVRYEKGERKIKRIVKEIKVPRYIAGIFLLFLFIGIPLSTSAYLGNHWFMEEPMDQRPYMRTIEGIAEWIVENTEEDDKIVAWHCYALEANRETLMEISNAKVYDGKRMIRLMEEENATLFVRCYYTNHGLWNNQPLFQEYVMSNYYLDRVIDGNECWLRMPPSSL